MELAVVLPGDSLKNDGAGQRTDVITGCKLQFQLFFYEPREFSIILPLRRRALICRGIQRVKRLCSLGIYDWNFFLTFPAAF